MPEDGNDRFRVVVVDDEYFVREMIKGAVDWEGLGFAVVGEAASARQAVEVILEERPQVVLLDISMPGDDGFAVAQAIRQHGLETRIVVVTGYSTFEFAKTAIRHHVYDYLLKPVSDAELAQILGGLRQVIGEERRSRQKLRTMADSFQDLLQRVEPAVLEELEPPVAPGEPEPSEGARELVQRVKDYVGEHLREEDLSVRGISDSLFVNMSHMSTVFKRTCGQGLHNYIRECRMEQAYRLILETQEPVDRVAAAVGFKNPVYFSKCLKRRYGRSFQELRSIRRKYLPGGGNEGSR